MKIFVFIILYLSITPAYADDLIQQRNEIIRQQQELEILREESVKQKRALEQQSREHEQEMQQLRRERKNALEQQRQEAEIQSIIDDWNAKKEHQEAIKESNKLTEYLHLKKDNEEAAARSTIVLDNKYYTQLASTLSQKGFTRSQINRITESHKAYIYRIARKAQAGEPEAEYKLGKSYYEGDGVKQDYQTAAKWLHKAAEQNNPEAQYGLFRMYTYGQGVNVDYDYAATVLHRAAENGHLYAQKLIEDIKRSAAAK